MEECLQFGGMTFALKLAWGLFKYIIYIDGLLINWVNACICVCISAGTKKIPTVHKWAWELINNRFCSPAELRDRIVLRHWSGEGYMSAALKVPKSTVASIILKWKKFGTTRRWPRTRWSIWLSSQNPVWRWEKLPEGQPSLQHSTDLWQSARQKPLLTERHMKAR